MSIPGFDLAQARYDREEPPSPSDLAAERDTDCLGHYDATDDNDAYECDERSTCPLCGCVVCREHDAVSDCGDGWAHEKCHDLGCYSAACAQDRRDDALLQRQEEEDGR